MAVSSTANDAVLTRALVSEHMQSGVSKRASLPGPRGGQLQGTLARARRWAGVGRGREGADPPGETDTRTIRRPITCAVIVSVSVALPGAVSAATAK